MDDAEQNNSIPAEDELKYEIKRKEKERAEKDKRNKIENFIISSLGIGTIFRTEQKEDQIFLRIPDMTGFKEVAIWDFRRKSNLKSYAEVELDILCKKYPDPDNPPVIKKFIPEILSLVNAFGNSGQSGGSAPFTAAVLSKSVKKLCLFEPICEITNLDDEWVSGHMDGPFEQNKRCGAMFRESKASRPYYLDAIIWKGDTKGESGAVNWDNFTGTVEGINSRAYVKKFPFTPKSFYIDVTRVPYDKNIHSIGDAVSCNSGDFVYLIKDKSQLTAVWEIYDPYDDGEKVEQ